MAEPWEAPLLRWFINVRSRTGHLDGFDGEVFTDVEMREAWHAGWVARQPEVDRLKALVLKVWDLLCQHILPARSLTVEVGEALGSIPSTGQVVGTDLDNFRRVAPILAHLIRTQYGQSPMRFLGSVYGPPVTESDRIALDWFDEQVGHRDG